MRLRLVGLLGSMVVLGVAGALALGQAGGKLLVIEKGQKGLAIVDPESGKEVASVPENGVGQDTGHEVGASRDGKLAFVPIYGNSGVGKPGTDGTEMVAIDIASRKVVSRIDFRPAFGGKAVRPHLPVMGPAVAGHPDGLLYVTSELAQAVAVIDPKTMKIIGTIPTGAEESHMLAVSHDGKRGYTANVGPGTVSVLDLSPKAAHNPVAVIPVAGMVQRISVSMDDKLVFTSDQTKPELDVIDTATNAVIKRVPMAALGYGSATTPDGKWLLVALASANQVAVVDLQTLTVARMVQVPAAPQAVLVQPDGRKAYVSCETNSKVAVLDLGNDLRSWSTVSAIQVGKLADGMAWAR
jgi:YVTN family beta-propeller protein